MKENSSGSRRKKLREAGYYTAVFLCILAVGISGYVFISSAVRQSRSEAALSAPLTAEVLPPEETEPAVSVPDATDAPTMQQQTEPQPQTPAARVTAAPVKGEIQQAFSVTELSYNPTTQDWRLHSAVDIAAEGQTVLACASGTVTQVYDDEYLGTTVVITHDGGYESVYSNLTAMPTVKAGDRVEAGTVIGAVGQTALAEAAQAPHLHFAVLKDGTPVDPMEFLEG